MCVNTIYAEEKRKISNKELFDEIAMCSDETYKLQNPIVKLDIATDKRFFSNSYSYMAYEGKTWFKHDYSSELLDSIEVNKNVWLKDVEFQSGNGEYILLYKIHFKNNVYISNANFSDLLIDNFVC